MTIDPTIQAQMDRVQAEFDALKALILEGLKKPTIPTGASGTISMPDATAPQITVDLESVNVRANPTISSTIMGQLLRGQTVSVSAVRVDADGKTDDTGTIHMWYELVSGGYVRHDVVRRIGDWSAFGLSAEPVPTPAPVLLPLPVRGATLTNTHHTDGPHAHLGWDLAAPLGTPITASAPGFVQWMHRCVPCGDEGRSRTDAGVLTDPTWGYGYGHYLIVRYRSDALPASTQLAYPKQHAFVMMAHLQRFSVNEGRVIVNTGQEIARLGSSGNSTGPHLHLEVRLSSLLSPLSWDSIRGGLIDPGVIFAHP